MDQKKSTIIHVAWESFFTQIQYMATGDLNVDVDYNHESKTDKSILHLHGNSLCSSFLGSFQRKFHCFKVKMMN